MSPTIWRISSLVIVAAVLAAACAEQPKKETPAAPPPAAAIPAAPPRPSEPELTPAQAKAQSQKLALEAVDQLQNGDEISARQTLAKALSLDPGNDIAKRMNDQIGADAQKELGPTFFRYTVARDDSLSKLAQQFLGDRYRFYILAKYNDITNPSRLAAGQVLKIPGRAPPPSAMPAPETTPKMPPAEAEVPTSSDLVALMRKGRMQQDVGAQAQVIGFDRHQGARIVGQRDDAQFGAA